MKKMVKHGLWAPLLGAILLSAGCMTAWDDDLAHGSDTGASSRELEIPVEDAVAADAYSPFASTSQVPVALSQVTASAGSAVATFISQSVPATMVGGQTYTVSITMRNDGTATWNRDGANPYRLGSQPQDTQLWVTTRAILPVATVTPGGLATFSFQVTAPSTPGTYDFQWRMLQELVQWFGPVTPKVAVAVTPGVPPLYSGFYLRNWPTGDGLRTQWSELFVSNPNDAPALVTIRVHKRTGGVHAVVQQTIPARGSWNSYGQPAWVNIPFTDSNASAGWIEVGSDRPVIATQRLTFRTGNAYNSPIFLLQDDVLSPEASTTLYATFYLKNWPTGYSGQTQWSNLVLVNPGCCLAANVTIKVYKVDGTGLLGSLTQSIAPGATFNTYGLSAWLNIPDASPRLGWVEVTSDRPLVGANRVTVRDGSTFNAPIVLCQDEAMSRKLDVYLGTSQFSKDWGQDESGTRHEWSNVILMNPSTSAATATVSIRITDGTYKTFEKTVPARGWWNSYQDPDWDTVQGSLGLVDVSSSSPIFGMNRKTVLFGSTFAGLDDALLTTSLTSAGYATPYLRNWPLGDGSTNTQWTNVVVSNPSRWSTAFTLNVYGENGGPPLRTFQKNIRSFERWDSYDDPEWRVFATGPASIGWIELIPSGPVRATNRVTLRSGTTYNAPIVSFHDVELVTTQP